MSQHIKYRAKQNPYLYLAALLWLGGFILLIPAAQARDSSGSSAVSSSFAATPDSAVTYILDQALNALRHRERETVFLMLTKDRQKEYGGTARGFMTFLRLHEHAIYDHTSYKMISSTRVSDKEIVYKIQLLSRSGHENIAIIKLLQEGGAHWHIQSMAVLVGNDEREI